MLCLLEEQRIEAISETKREQGKTAEGKCHSPHAHLLRPH